MTRDAFGPNLRRLRIQQGISIYQLAQATKVSAHIWEGLEQNDFSTWPTGILARAYVRQYANAIGVDADATVDEFCRWFPQGDRRAERVVREHAEMVGHELEWTDNLDDPNADRRRGPEGEAVVPVPRPERTAAPAPPWYMRIRRVLGS
jgi:transcriptional regulator with XRE-family HTH domain